MWYFSGMSYGSPWAVAASPTVSYKRAPTFHGGHHGVVSLHDVIFLRVNSRALRRVFINKITLTFSIKLKIIKCGESANQTFGRASDSFAKTWANWVWLLRTKHELNFLSGKDCMQMISINPSPNILIISLHDEFVCSQLVRQVQPIMYSKCLRSSCITSKINRIITRSQEKKLSSRITALVPHSSCPGWMLHLHLLRRNPSSALI
jgi:hypothetical protein